MERLRSEERRVGKECRAGEARRRAEIMHGRHLRRPGVVRRVVLIGGVQLGFFFQAEDGIRDLTVTGVQTCALPILDCDWGWARFRSLVMSRLLLLEAWEF